MGYATTLNTDGTTSSRYVRSPELVAPNESYSSAPPQPSLADIAAMLIAAVQSWLDTTAAGNGYDSLASCISYRGSSVAQWSADADAALAWRDAVWQACFQWQQNAAADPPTTPPTAEQVIAQLPQPEAFGWVVHAPGETTP